MIPPRMLSNENEIFGTGKGLKNRVTACRKRIRLNRFHRVQVNTESDGGSLKSASGVSEFPGYQEEEPSVRGALVQALDRETSQRVAEQEVGLT
jgi:hypothetical protein